MPAPRFYLHSYGCQMNKLDSELVTSKLLEAGYELAENEAAADVVLLNTCAVRQHAEDRVWSRLGVLRIRKRREPHLVVGVLGCMAQEHQQLMQARMPHVDLVVGPSAFGDIDRKVEQARERNLARPKGHEGAGLVAIGQGADPDRIERNVRVRPLRSQAYISIMRGCNMPCSYCIVPLTRGPEISRPIQDIVDEAQRLADDGVTEITLLGQTVNAYGRDLGAGASLAALLRALHAIPMLRRIAFITSHPNFVSSELIEALTELPRLARFLHLPAQSGSTAVLKTMRRGYTAERYVERAEQLLARVPGLELHSDFIVGYPSETVADFEQTVALMQRLRFAQSYVFKYSPRPGTAAAALIDDVADREKERRNQVLLALQSEHSLARHRSLVGSVQEALVEGPSPRGEGRMAGRTVHHRIVHFAASDPGLVGCYVPVRIVQALPHALVGERLADDHVVEATVKGSVETPAAVSRSA